MNKYFSVTLFFIPLFIRCVDVSPQVSYDIRVDINNNVKNITLTINNNSGDNIVLMENPIRIFLNTNDPKLFPFLPKMKYQPFTFFFYKDSLSFYDIGITYYDNIYFDRLIRVSAFKKQTFVFLQPDFADSVINSSNYLLSFITYAKEREILKKIYSSETSIRDSLILNYKANINISDTIYLTKFFIGDNFMSNHSQLKKLIN